jgi:hypothetical protein
MPPLTVPFTTSPPTGPLASGDVPQSLLQSPPLACHIAITPTGKADGGFDVSWAVLSVGASGWVGNPVTLASGCLRMLPTDLVAKLLYQIRAGVMEGLKSLTVAQILPPQPDTTYVTAPSGSTPASGSYFYISDVDWVALLPSNPANVGL